MTFSALLCITLQILMVYCTIYDDIGYASKLKLELLDWIGLRFMGVICLNRFSARI